MGFSLSSFPWNARCVAHRNDVFEWLRISLTLKRRGCLQLRSSGKQREKLNSTSVVDQLVVAADIKPRRFRTKWQKFCYEGPTARQDSASAERSRWVNLLTDLLRNTDTTMGAPTPGKSDQLPVCGRGPESWYSTFTCTQHPEVPHMAYGRSWVTFPVHWRQLTEYAQVRLSEPCVRYSLKLLNNSFLFQQEVDA